MNKKRGAIFIFLFLILLSGFFLIKESRASFANVFINEVCWMGDSDSANNEWIELKNNTNKDIHLDGWRIKSLDGSPSINLTGVLSANGYFLLERSDDNSVVDIVADLIYVGSLGNKGEGLFLVDDDDRVIDEIEIKENEWPAGNNKTKQTMERNEDGGWQTSKEERGTPKKKNSKVDRIKDKEETKEVEEVGIKKSKISTVKIKINEISPNPKGSDRKREFIELYNSGDNSIDLAGWRLENERGQIYEFGRLDNVLGVFTNNIIKAKGYLAIFRDVSNIALNNNGGEIKLFSVKGKVAKQVLKYGKAEEGLAYVNSNTIDLNKITTSTKKFLLNSTKINKWVWSRIATPGRSNQVFSVNNAPRVLFSVPKEINPGENIFFDSSDTIDEDGDELKFKWDFGDGITLELAEPTHVFLRPGEYEIKLEVNDGKELGVLSKKIKVLGDVLINDDNNNDNNNDNNIISNNYNSAWVEDINIVNDYKLNLLKEENILREVSLEVAKKLPSKTEVKIKGVVVVPPNVFGSQYFYIINKDSLKIYNYRKDFPELLLGDEVVVKGEIAEANNVIYLKVKKKEDIEIISNKEIKPMEIDEMNDIYLGKLVRVKGNVLSIKRGSIFLDSNSNEIKIVIKRMSGIDVKEFNVDDKMSITGIVLKASGELVVEPRIQSDLKLNFKNKKGVVAGVSDNVNEWKLAERDKENNLNKYLIILFFISLVGGSIFYIKLKNKG